MPYWFTATRIPPQGQESQPSDVLTEEQFAALPVIEYVPVPPDENDANSLEDVDIAVDGAGSEVEEEEENDATPDMECALPQSDLNDDNNERQTTCTMCSVCIDDFEEGERLILLPVCKRKRNVTRCPSASTLTTNVCSLSCSLYVDAFHGDCIKPWLLERQGCCPLCKTAVLQSDEAGQETESEQASSVRNPNEVVDQSSTVPSPEGDEPSSV